MRVTLTWMLLVLLAGCGGPTWLGITREVAAGDAALEAGDPSTAATRYRRAAADLEMWLDSRAGRGLRPDLDAGRVRIGRWTLAAFRSAALPRAALWARAATDPLAAAYVGAARRAEEGARAAACLDAALELAAAGRAGEARVVLAEAEEIPQGLAPPELLPRQIDLACRLGDDARLEGALARMEEAAPGLSDGDLQELLEATAGVLAARGRCGLAAELANGLGEALEARWVDPDPCGADAADEGPSWNLDLFELFLSLADVCRAAKNIDGALNLLDEAVPRAEVEGDEALRVLGRAYIEAGLPGEAAALAGSVDDRAIRDDLLVDAAAAWVPGGGPPAPEYADVVLWLEAAEAAAAKAHPRETAKALLLEIATRWEALGDLERAAAARARASDLNLQLDP